MSVLASDVLLYLSEGVTTAPVARAARKFAASRPIDFAVLAAFHARSPYGTPRRSAAAAWRNDLQALAAIGALLGAGDADALSAGFKAGEYPDARKAAEVRYADALLRLDEWLVVKGLRAAERDRRTYAWDIEE